MEQRRQDLKRVVSSLLEEERRKWPRLLVAYCGEDVDLFLDASTLLAVSGSAGDFIDSPAIRLLENPGEPVADDT